MKKKEKKFKTKKISMESDLFYLWSNYCKKLNKKYKGKNVYLSIYVYKKK
jgi:hypothetical protein